MSESVERALGGIAVSSNRPPWRAQLGGAPEALDAVGDDATREMLALLLSTVLNLTRRMDYLFIATAPFATHADPALVRLVERDREALERDEPKGGLKAALLSGDRMEDVLGPLHQKLIEVVLETERMEQRFKEGL